MSKKIKAFAVTGVVNTAVEDAGLTSPQGEKRHCNKIFLTVSAAVGDTIEVWLEEEKLMTIYDYLVDGYGDSGATNILYPTNKPNSFEVDADIPVGQVLKVILVSGGTAINIFGGYEYEVIE